MEQGENTPWLLKGRKDTTWRGGKTTWLLKDRKGTAGLKRPVDLYLADDRTQGRCCAREHTTWLLSLRRNASGREETTPRKLKGRWTAAERGENRP